jgi:hypothetical protein
MNCNDVDRWLDDGMPARDEARARAHAAACARCGAALAALAEIDALLAAPPLAPAPRGFTDRVMARVARADAAVAHATATLSLPLPWWVRIAAEPSTALALLLAGVTLLKANALLALSSSVAAWVAALGTRVAAAPTPALPDLLSQPVVLFGLALALAPAAAWLSWVLFAWTERLIMHPATAMGHSARPR